MWLHLSLSQPRSGGFYFSLSHSLTQVGFTSLCCRTILIANHIKQITKEVTSFYSKQDVTRIKHLSKHKKVVCTFILSRLTHMRSVVHLFLHVMQCDTSHTDMLYVARRMYSISWLDRWRPLSTDTNTSRRPFCVCYSAVWRKTCPMGHVSEGKLARRS